MLTKSSFKLLAAATIGLAAVTTANAQLVTQWTANVTTSWVVAGPGAPTFSTGNGTQEVEANLISWGGTGSHTIAGQDASIARSAVGIEGGNVVTLVDTNGPSVDTALFSHYNNTINASRATLQTATVLTTLQLTPFSPAGGALPVLDTTFLINFIETLNDEPCFAGSVSVCDDIFVISLGDLLTDFEYNGIQYTVGITGDLLPLSDAACLAANAGLGCFGLQTEEGAITTAQFAFNIIAQVPEPGVLALLGLGLAGLGAASRRRAAR